MNDQFVTYQIAKKLKELGFDEECLRWQISERNNQTADFIFLQYKRDDEFVYLPLWQQAIDWLRMKHGIIIIIDLYNGPDGWVYEIKQWMNGGEGSGRQQFTYEQAREAAILKAIELIQH